MMLNRRLLAWQSLRMMTWRQVTVNYDDDHYIEISLALQLTQLDMYNKVLIERQRRKKYTNIITGGFILLVITP